jgi:HD-like signal output (HDOD) protein
MLHHELRSEEFVVHELHADDDGEPLSDQQLWDALTRTFQSPRYQPPMLPQVATDLLALSTRSDVEIDTLVHLLEKDSLLAARVLKLCNSPLYGAASPIRSLKAAVVRMGLAELRDVVMEASLSFRVFKTTGYSEAVDRVRLHSTAVAHLARAITRFTSFEAEYAFLCGLLHDVGVSAALVALGDAPRGQKLRPVVDLWPALAALHETVGGSVATLWKLPQEIAMVLRLHHTLKVGDVVHPVAAIVTLAESIAAQHGFGLVPQPRKVAGSEVPPLLFGPHRFDAPSFTQVLLAQGALGFDKPQMERVNAACKQVLDSLRAA